MSVFAQLQRVLAKVNTLCAHLTRDMWRLMLHRHLSVCVHVCLECVLSGDLQTGGGVQAPVLCRLMLRRFGKSLWRESWGSWIDERELLARMRETRPGYMRPSLRTSTHSCSWLSVICSSRRDGHCTDDTLTLSNSFRHRNNSSSLNTHKKTNRCFSAWQNNQWMVLKIAIRLS